MGKDEGEAVRSPRMLLQREKKKRVQDQSPGSGKRKKINGFQEDGTRSRQRRDLAAEDRVLSWSRSGCLEADLSVSGQLPEKSTQNLPLELVAGLLPRPGAPLPQPSPAR